jgi:protein-S-isoprenylcysteine O-methyltransferase Ste14
LTVVNGGVIYISAGTIRKWQGSVNLILLTGISSYITQDLQSRDPALLERRMKGGPTAEPRPRQRLIMLGASIGFFLLVIVPALDRRFHWSIVPTPVIVFGDLLFALGFVLIGRVYHENTYTSATVEVMQGQHVISSGPYGVVRHPMYASALLYLIGTPLALGSYWGLLALAAMVPFIVWRLIDEEQVLEVELPGYREYRSHVRYRLIPGVW